MPTLAFDPRAASVVLPALPSPAHPSIGVPRIGGWPAGVTYWPAELLRLVALIYMLPVVIYMVCLPIAAGIKTVLLLASWSWKTL